MQRHVTAVWAYQDTGRWDVRRVKWSHILLAFLLNWCYRERAFSLSLTVLFAHSQWDKAYLNPEWWMGCNVGAVQRSAASHWSVIDKVNERGHEARSLATKTSKCCWNDSPAVRSAFRRHSLLTPREWTGVRGRAWRWTGWEVWKSAPFLFKVPRTQTCELF